MRGKVDGLLSAIPQIRITPACAGKRRAKRGNNGLNEDHPRVCGEKFNAKKANKAIKGSPPRVRGKALCADGFRRLIRITPACAGKSRLIKLIVIRHKDHPRVCGEKLDNST